MPSGSLTTQIDTNFILINKLAVLVLTLLFFSAMLLKNRSCKETARSLMAPINLSLLGLILLYAEYSLKEIPRYHDVVSGLQTVVVLLCLAKLVIYLIIDLYLPFRSKREPPGFLRDTIRLVVYLLIGVVSLRVVFDVNLSAVVTTTTVLTAMIAFALQNSLTNALSGFAIQSEKLLDRHNWISIKEKNIFGEIVNVGFRYTTLRNPDNNLVMVPNSAIIQNVVTIYGTSESEDRPAVLLDVMLEYCLPPETARELLLTVLKNEPMVLPEPSPMVRLLTLGDSGIVYQMKFWIGHPGQKVPAADRIYTQIWYAATRAGYSFPFPHRQVITAEQKEPFAFSRSLVLRELQQMDLFAGLAPEQLESMAENAPVRVFGPGEVVVSQGDSGSSLFIVLKGSLDVLVDRVKVGGLAEDSFFGEMSLLTGAPRAATVRAGSEVWLVEVTKNLMEPILRHNPGIMETLSAILEERGKANLVTRQTAGRQQEPISLRDDYLKRLKSFFGL